MPCCCNFGNIYEVHFRITHEIWSEIDNHMDYFHNNFQNQFPIHLIKEVSQT